MYILLQIFCAFLLLYAVSAYGLSRQNQQQQQQRRQQASNQRQSTGFAKVFEWKQLDYQFPNPQIRQQAIQGRTFIEKNSAMPLSLQADQTRLFISAPRWRQGVPSTLNYVSLVNINNQTASSPQLVPYPNLNFNRQGNCEGVTSVFRMQVDHCNRLWVVDTGKVGAQQVCPPQVVAFDLATDKVIYKHRFSQEALKCNSQPTNIAVEYKKRGECGQPKPDAFLYVTDTAGYAIIVIDTKSEKSWLITHKTMFPAPEAGTFNIAGQQFDLMDGIVGLALGPMEHRRGEGDIYPLYYNPMTSYEQFMVPTFRLQNQNATQTEFRNFNSGKSKKRTQSAGCGMDSAGVLYFGLLKQNALACWNSGSTFEEKNFAVLAQSDTELQFLSTVVVDQSNRIWALSTRFHRFYTNTLDPEEINFRVFTASARDVVRGTVCSAPTLGERPMRGRA